MDTTTVRCAIYARVSKSDASQDTDNQLAQLREYCSRSGYQIVHEYIDHASGKSGDRDEFKAMFRDAAQRKFDLVLTWALDRLTREGIHETFAYIKRLVSSGVQFASYTEEHFRTTGPAGELMIALAAWIAQQERQRISERTKAGLERARREGRIGGRRKKVFDRSKVKELADVGASMREIAIELNISAASVCRILKAS
jgi:DNA invertase Pin-like site-specific DNA recombinase